MKIAKISNGPQRPRCGLFSHILQALCGISKAIEWKVPFYVDFNDPAMSYFVLGGHKGVYNVWEYYFQQPHKINGNEIINLDDAMVDHLSQSSRLRLHDATKHVVLKRHVLDKIDRFYEENMKSKKVVGIHYRGTDMRMWRIPTCDEFINEASKYGSVVFIATDDYNAAKYFRSKFKNNIIMYNATRGKRPLHVTRPSNPYKIGEEAIIDSYLLARCSHIVRLRSNLSQYSIYLNNKIGYSVFRYKDRQWLHAGPDQLV